MGTDKVLIACRHVAHVAAIDWCGAGLLASEPFEVSIFQASSLGLLSNELRIEFVVASDSGGQELGIAVSDGLLGSARDGVVMLHDAHSIHHRVLHVED